MGYELKPWLTIVHAAGGRSDAADFNAAILLSMIHSHLLSEVTTDVRLHHFIIATKDHFADEVKTVFCLMKRKCHSFGTIREMFDEFINIQLTFNIVPPRAPQKELLEKKPQSENIKKVYPIFVRLEQDPSDTLLREFFKVAWLGTGKSSNGFCTSLGLDSSTFSKYHRGLKRNNQCRNAVLKLYNDRVPQSIFDRKPHEVPYLIRFDNTVFYTYFYLNIYEDVEEGPAC